MAFEKKTTKTERIGHVVINHEQFSNLKMQKLNLKNCFDSSAYFEAFLLKLPLRVQEVDEEYDAHDEAAFSDKMMSYMSEKLTHREALTSKSRTLDSHFNFMRENSEEELSFNNGLNKMYEK